MKKLKVGPSLAANVPPTASGGIKHVEGFVNLFLADVHYGAEITAADTEGDNVYNTGEALKRTKLAFDELLARSSQDAQGARYSRAVLWLGGDIIEGFRCNLGFLGQEDGLPERNASNYALFFYHQLLRLAEAGFAEVFVNVVPGNHGKLTSKEKRDRQLVDNLDRVFANQLAAHCAEHNRKHTACSFVVTQATASGLLHMELYGVPFVLCHGDNEGFDLGQKGRSGKQLMGCDEVRRGALSYRAALVESYKRRSQDRATNRALPGAVNWAWDRMMLLFAGRHTSTPAADEGVIGCGAVRGVDKYALERQAIFALEAPSALYWVVKPEGMGYVQRIALAPSKTAVSGVSTSAPAYRFLDWSGSEANELPEMKKAA